MTSVVLGDESVDWDDIRERASAIAPELRGARAVAVVAEPTLHVVATILAAIEAGVPAIPLSVDSGASEREHVLRDSGADLIDEGGVLSPIAVSAQRSAIDADTALVLYTSGTTGAPKGVQLSERAIESCIDALADAWNWTAEDRLVHGLPLHHVHGLILGVLGALRVGCSFQHTGRPNPEAYAAAAGTLYFGVPTVWTRVAQNQSAARSLASARLLVSGSAALPRTTFDALQSLVGHAPIERYGMTETLITLSARASEPAVQGTVGKPVSGTSTRVVDGELQVHAPSMFGGYLNLPEATTQSFTGDGWFKTGDVASIDDDGTHRIVGRASTDLIKSGGYRIGAGEIEDSLLTHSAVKEAAVVGLPDDDLGQRIVAFVVASGCTEQDLIDHVAAELAWHKRPRTVVFVDMLPRNSMGKVMKVRLTEL